MKKQLVSFLLFVGGLFAYNSASAQLSVQVNLGIQPAWGPVGYDRVEYYYIPDYDVYYHVPRKQFIYLDGSAWNFGATLPTRYGTVNLYNAYKVVVNEPRPYLRNYFYREKYARYRGWRGERQENFHDEDDDDDERYFDDNNNHSNNYGKHNKGNRERRGKHHD